MSRRRRAVVLAVLALLLGSLAASDVAGREAALRRSLGVSVGVLVAQEAVAAGAPLARARLALRRVPARYAPADAFSGTADVAGLKAAVAIPAGTDLTPSLVADPAQIASAAVPVGPGERVAEIVAQGSPEHIVRGSRVDVVVTRETADSEGETTLALEDAEVLSAAPAPATGRGLRTAGGPVAACAAAGGRLPRRGAVLRAGAPRAAAGGGRPASRRRGPAGRLGAVSALSAELDRTSRSGRTGAQGPRVPGRWEAW